MHAQPFDPLAIAVEGTNLIEASAGTGKTYNIAALFTRLIVLEKMPVESILVVTFTKAATAELKTRLRARLDDALSALEHGGTSDGLQNHCLSRHPGDGFILPLLQQALQHESRERLMVRLQAAISRFDNASIYTIHGFCQRLLRDYAFLCQVPFDVSLTGDTRERLLTPAQDFWREKVSPDPLLAQLVFKNRQTPQTALAAVKHFTGRPYLVFRRPESDLAASYAAAEQSWQEIRTALPALEEKFWALFATVLNGTYFKKPSYQELFATLQQAAAHNRLPEVPQEAKKKEDFFKRLENLSAETLPGKIKKGKTLDAQTQAGFDKLAAFGRQLAGIAQTEQNALAALYFDLLDYLAAALAEHKKNHRERVFDDLLLDVYHALATGAHADALAQAAAADWQAALIDEFQDTDPLQYTIFSRLFAGQNRPLFLVGDPKQAIYSFRGADIHAYLQAAHDAGKRYTLAVNHRSHGRLIRGINALFRLKNRPFVIDHIGYADVGASRETCRLNAGGSAIQVRWLNRPDENSNKDMLRNRAAAYCADEIAGLLNQAAAGRLNYRKHPDDAGKPLQSGQIAVLVRTYNEGRMAAAELKKRGIQSVLLSRESVFATEEAAAVAALLGFWLQPHDTGPLRFVLGGVLFNQTAAELYALNRDENSLLEWMASAHDAAETWQQYGIYAAMQQFAARHGIEERLLAEGNERSLTNYHQIIERLAEESGHNLGPAPLHQWLLSQIQTAADNTAHPDNNLLRLESDENLVQIVTMHAAKGLQYPVVFCPFVWDSKKPENHWQILHRNGQAELLAPHQPDEADSSRLADENLSENLRLLYVALTRAEERLTVYAAHCSDTPRNPLAYLLEGGTDAGRAETEAAYTAAAKTERAAKLKRNWQQFIANAPPNTDFAFTEDIPPAANYRPPAASDGRYLAQNLPVRLFETINHTSFTGLSRQTRHRSGDREQAGEELQPAVDLAETGDAPVFRPSENPPSPGGRDIHAFARGADAGVCLHEILEQFDFSTPASDQSDLVRTVLERYGFEPHWQQAVETMLDHTRSAPLGSGTLADTPTKRRRAEMAFTLHMHDFTLKHLQQWFARPDNGLPAECAAAAQLLDFNDVKGFLNGFIDMVCLHSDGLVTLIDYKSNHLGPTAADYHQAAMNEAVAHHHYYLQALIYAIAAARYFRSRQQPVQKIAVRYLFLRGLNGSGNGIWAWDFDIGLLSGWLENG
ncbi:MULTISPECIES: exodeoxyribonuclease V subunit beta [unclassified Neisseria]|uniref:exodeoxyribonuclease V subunit beta n=1 Tax=unclassified Neisseria TaxID=2623750 RepID=UPI0010729F4F|nr:MULTISPECIES: exodeoxyribonuclease V subunit beta [unclassified Neisseria]MBF0802784.1 exodeoxyribonuclease V subunit beta [Neisseria sp. 19428wB4_WF04]TFU44581.1 exodeoxyribonuclease V subunit beta [Neisseria sp. WF04]